jgi:hypothetical protein
MSTNKSKTDLPPIAPPYCSESEQPKATPPRRDDDFGAGPSLPVRKRGW